MGITFGKKIITDNSNNIQDLYRRYSQESIFYLVFGYLPIENVKVTSPFRVDTNPNCWFTYNGPYLMFVDFANSEVINGVKMKSVSAFYCVKAYFNMTDTQAFNFIYDKLLSIKIDTTVKTFDVVDKKRSHLFVYPTEFKSFCKDFWSSYGISYQNLVDDKVFPCSKVLITNSKYGNFIYRFYKVGYAYTDFESLNKKVYNPYSSNKKDKFFTDTNQDDIGNINNLIGKDSIIITKSYKDCRVITNAGYDSIWLQNEGMIPNNKVFYNILKSYEKVYIIFDNDEAGIKASNYLSSVLLSHSIQSTNISIPTFKNITDSSDLYKYKGRDFLHKLLNNKIT